MHGLSVRGVLFGDKEVPKEITVETMIRRDLPCSNPQLVEGYIAIEEILKGRSTDFDTCGEGCGIALCKHALDEKREDESYKLLVRHFRDGGMINVPVIRWNGSQSNGHHRVVAALDAGFTHIPYMTNDRFDGGGWGTNWTGTNAEQYGFRVVTDNWGSIEVQPIAE